MTKKVSISPGADNSTVQFPPKPNRGGNCTQKKASKSLKSAYCIGFDYLKVAVKKSSGVFADIFSKKTFLFEQRGDCHAGEFFKEIYNFDTIIDGETDQFCTVECLPRLTTIPQDYAYVKLQNKWLYYQDGIKYLSYFLASYGLEFHHITRLDVYCDFQQSGANMDVQKFMIANITGNIQRSGQGTVWLKKDKSIETMYWGSRKSGFQVILYDKSKELREQTHKPYIYESWINAGFDMSNDAYRLEFRCAQGDLKVEVAEVLDYENFTTLLLKNAPSYFKMLHDKFFTFKKKSKTDTNKRRWKDFQLLTINEQFPSFLKYKKYTSCKSSGKRFVEQFHQEIKTITDTQQRKIAISLLEKMLIDRSLMTWFEVKNGTDFEAIFMTASELKQKQRQTILYKESLTKKYLHHVN